MAAHYNVLFLCTGNSALSIMAEAILNHRGKGVFTGVQRGESSFGTPRPEALREIASARMSTEGLRSKSWDEFSLPGAPHLDFVFTVCDSAAKEACPYWPGQPITAHWGVPDPAAVNGTPEEIERAFNDAFVVRDRRIGLFLALPMATLEQLAFHQEIDRIGRASGQLCFAVWLRSLGDAAAARCGGGFGIMGERLAAGKVAIRSAAEYAGDRSGADGNRPCVWADLRAHLNPAVTPNGSQ